MRLTPDYACDNVREVPGKKTKEILFSIFSHSPTPNPRASGQSITVFIFLRALHDIYSAQGRCMKVYPANLLVHDIKSCHLGEQREVTQEPHAKRGACGKVRLLRFVWAKPKWKFIRDRGKLFFFLRILRLRPSRAHSLAARSTSTNAGNTCFLPFSLFGCIVQSEISVLTVKASTNIHLLSLSLVPINQYASASSNFIYIIRARKTKAQQNKTIRTKRAKNECTAFVEFNIRTR